MPWKKVSLMDTCSARGSKQVKVFGNWYCSETGTSTLPILLCLDLPLPWSCPSVPGLDWRLEWLTGGCMHGHGMMDLCIFQIPLLVLPVIHAIETRISTSRMCYVYYACMEWPVNSGMSHKQEISSKKLPYLSLLCELKTASALT